ncbi:MAG: pyridoxine 5'-phosphate synthase [Phycisphaerales bacterium]|nr:pyridoxine 5'-phosphate synthase [Planctomycetota bacterium]MBL6997316.1 pyridoxine 5'-phosphate synthase [Phycisphaerales bacterium]
MIKLCVNIDHVATIREARKTIEPDPILAAKEACLGGADGITLHIREDRRHMQDEDLFRLRKIIKVPLNLELAATPEMIDLALKSNPDMAMLVPEGRNEITTEGGLDIAADINRLRDMVAALTEGGMRVSAFVDAKEEQIDAVLASGCTVCEIHTGQYAESFINNNFVIDNKEVQHERANVHTAVQYAVGLGLQCNAGHGLTHLNVSGIASIENISELHIGHSIVSRSVLVGMQTSVREMKQQIEDSSHE